MLSRSVVVIVLACLMLTSSASMQSPHPRVLETLTVSDGEAVAINVNNQVALVNGQRSFLWTDGSGLVELGGFAADIPQTRAYDLSDAGHVVGRTLSADGFLHPFIWTLATGMVDADPGFDSEGAAWAVNESGEIVGGEGLIPSVSGTAFRRLADGVFTRVNPLGGNCGSAAYDINMFSLAVGESSVPGGCGEPYVYHPFVWGSTAVRDLGTLGGTDGRAMAINSLNQVAGDSTTAAGQWHAFIWSERTGMRDLGTLGGASSIVRAINEFGHVVGTSVNAQGQQRAFLWRPFEGLVDLGPGDALAINEFDHVVGTTIDAGTARAFLWTASDGRIELSGGSRAVGLNNYGWIAGDRQGSGAPSQVVVWRIGIVAADWVTYRQGLVDAHVAFGALGSGQARALRAQLRSAVRAMEAGRGTQADRALLRFDRQLSTWAPEELPWQ